ncbi:MAG: RNA methyltransferase [Lachnospiraceae bacterium]|nr:RNA methyltransferase [Lachnospiraceae bacterium]
MSITEKIQTRNALYQKFEVLKTNRNKRYKYQEFIVEGVRNINECIEKGWEIASILYTRELPLSDWAQTIIQTTHSEKNYELTAELMRALSDKEDTSELLLVVKMRNDELNLNEFSKNPVVALFDRPSNKGNLGTVIRSCDALGVECLIVSGHSVDIYEPAVITSSMGSFFNLKIVRMPENQMVFEFIRKMKKQYPTFQVIGTTAHKEYPLYELDLSTPVMFMIGNETDGLCHAFKDTCDLLGTIPMAQTSYASSFNVGCAATVMFYEAARQRQQYGAFD